MSSVLTVDNTATEVIVVDPVENETVLVSPVDDEVKFITISEGSQGPRGPEGPRGPAGQDSIQESDLSFVFTQNVPSARWVIAHPLEFVPNVTVVDSAGTEQIGDVDYPDAHTIVTSFSGAFSGTAYLS